MPKLPIAICLTSCLLAACGTSPQLPMPNGWNRVAVSSQAAIDEYNAAAAREAASAKEEAQRRQQAALKSELAQLKALMVELAPDESPAGAKTPVPVRAKAATPGSAAGKATGAQYRPSETVIQRDRSILFGVALGAGETRFSPSLAFRQALLNAASKAARIDIRGVGGALKAKGASVSIAKMRAENVRKYLLANGIDITRIKTPELDAGIGTAGGAGSEARASNRGVDIEVMAPDKAVLQASDPTTSGGLQ